MTRTRLPKESSTCVRDVSSGARGSSGGFRDAPGCFINRIHQHHTSQLHATKLRDKAVYALLCEASLTTSANSQVCTDRAGNHINTWLPTPSSSLFLFFPTADGNNPGLPGHCSIIKRSTPVSDRLATAIPKWAVVREGHSLLSFPFLPSFTFLPFLTLLPLLTFPSLSSATETADCRLSCS